MASELTSQNALLLLKDLMGQTNSWIFNRPVDYVALNVPTYPEVFKTADPQIIKRPMDLGAIKSKVEKRAYISLPFFRADVELVFSNAIVFNGADSEVGVMARELVVLFEQLFSDLVSKQPEEEHVILDGEGVIAKISEDRKKCLIRYDNGYQCWEPYENLEPVDGAQLPTLEAAQPSPAPTRHTPRANRKKRNLDDDSVEEPPKRVKTPREKKEKPPKEPKPVREKPAARAAPREAPEPKENISAVGADDVTRATQRITESEKPFGVLFWVKFAGHPFWPARLALQDEVSPQLWRSGKPGQYFVFFFGERTYAWARDYQIESWVENYEKNTKIKKRKSFDEAMEQAEAWLALDRADRLFPLYIAPRAQNPKQGQKDEETLCDNCQSITTSFWTGPGGQGTLCVECIEHWRAICLTCDQKITMKTCLYGMCSACCAQWRHSKCPEFFAKAPETRPLVVVVGGTGQQGNGVARALLQQQFHVRVLTRTPSSQPARELQVAGAELRYADLSKPETLAAALEGSPVAAFLVTNYWECLSAEAETAMGVNFTDACLAAKVGHLVFSTLPDAKQLSNGTLDIPAFQSKRKIQEHIAASGITFTCVQVRIFVPYPAQYSQYMESLIHSVVPRPEGKRWVYALPMSEAQQPLVSLVDAGKFVAEIIKAKSHIKEEVALVGDKLSWAQIAKIISERTHRGVDYRAISDQEYLEQAKDRAQAELLLPVFQFWRDYAPSTEPNMQSVGATTLDQFLQKAHLKF